jgi:hypothetical protein
MRFSVAFMPLLAALALANPGVPDATLEKRSLSGAIGNITTALADVLAGNVPVCAHKIIRRMVIYTDI